MAGVFESFKRFYCKENITKNGILFGVICIASLLSLVVDTVLGNPDSIRQNFVDLILGFALAFYSLQFLHAAVRNPDSALLPNVKNSRWDAIGGMILLNIVWFVYFLIIGMLVFIWLFITKDFILPVIIGLLMCLTIPFMAFIYIAFSENFSFIELLNPIYIFKIIKTGFVPLIINLIKFLGVGIVVILVLAVLYAIGYYFSLPDLVPSVKDITIIDVIAEPICVYIILIIMYFIFPYSLLDAYREKVRPELLNEIPSFVENQPRN